MNVFAQLNSKHPAFSTVLGISSGAFSGLVAWVEALTKVFGMVGAAAGAAVAVMTLAIKLRQWRAEAEAVRPFTEPMEGDDIPL